VTDGSADTVRQRRARVTGRATAQRPAALLLEEDLDGRWWDGDEPLFHDRVGVIVDDALIWNRSGHRPRLAGEDAKGDDDTADHDAR
jgi:hypothetical protein